MGKQRKIAASHVKKAIQNFKDELTTMTTFGITIPHGIYEAIHEMEYELELETQK